MEDGQRHSSPTTTISNDIFTYSEGGIDSELDELPRTARKLMKEKKIWTEFTSWCKDKGLEFVKQFCDDSPIQFGERKRSKEEFLYYYNEQVASFPIDRSMQRYVVYIENSVPIQI